MANDQIEKARKLEERIKELQDRQKRHLDKAHKEVVKYLMEQWDIENISLAKKVIGELRNKAQEIQQNEGTVDE